MKKKSTKITTAKSKYTIKRNLKLLRSFIDDGKNDPLAIRIAYAMETAIRWTIEDTVGWDKPVDEAQINALIFKNNGY